MEPEKEETLGYTHKVIGTIAFAFLLLQVRTLSGSICPASAALSAAQQLGLCTHVPHVLDSLHDAIP
jgi:hypothetical protein